MEKIRIQINTIAYINVPVSILRIFKYHTPILDVFFLESRIGLLLLKKIIIQNFTKHGWDVAVNSLLLCFHTKYYLYSLM